MVLLLIERKNITVIINQSAYISGSAREEQKSLQENVIILPRRGSQGTQHRTELHQFSGLANQPGTASV